MAVKIVRLKSNEELITEYQDNGDEVVVKKPTMLIPVGEGRFGLAPWLPYAETDEVTLPKDIVWFALEPKPELASEYTNATSNIVVPDNTLVGAGVGAGGPAGDAGNLKLTTD